MEFAASWKPFMKSNATASTTSKAITQKLTCIASIKLSESKRGASGVLEDHALDQVGHVFAAIGDGFELLVDRFQLDQLTHVFLFAEELGHRRTQHAIGIGFELVDLFAGLHGRLGDGALAEFRQQRGGVTHALAALAAQVG